MCGASHGVAHRTSQPPRAFRSSRDECDAVACRCAGSRTPRPLWIARNCRKQRRRLFTKPDSARPGLAVAQPDPVSANVGPVERKNSANSATGENQGHDCCRREGTGRFIPCSRRCQHLAERRQFVEREKARAVVLAMLADRQAGIGVATAVSPRRGATGERDALSLPSCGRLELGGR